MSALGRPKPLGTAYWHARSQQDGVYPGRMRILFMLAAQGEGHWRRGWQYAEELAQQPQYASHDICQAYIAVMRMTQARYSRWPLEQFTLANTGVATLEALVPADPSHELRWIRTAAYLHLPSWYGKGEQVAADQLRLAEATPDLAHTDPELCLCVTDFLITADQLPTRTLRDIAQWRQQVLAGC